MKNVTQIISSLQNKPQFSKLLEYACIERIKSSLLFSKQNLIKSAYIKNNILIFILAHPSHKQEVDNNIESIKTALKLHPAPECANILIEEIKTTTIFTRKENLMTTAQDKIQYKERANGNFVFNSNDEKLNAIFESIKKIIQEKNR
jgi:hypothetical protein